MPQQTKWIDDDTKWVDDPEPSFWNDTVVPNLLGTVPAIAGTVIGGALGGPWGAVGGGMAGSGIGSTLRQGYEMDQINPSTGRPVREGFNPLTAGVETALGGIGGFAKFPGVGAGAKALAKYAGWNALEGAAIGAAGTPFQYAAETGSFEPGWENVGTNALVGGGMGATLGLGLPYGLSKLGTQQAIPPSAPPPDLPPPPPSVIPPISPSAPPHAYTGQGELGLEGDLRQPNLPYPQRYIESGDRAVKTFEEPYFYDYGPQQQDLKFGSYRNESGKFTNEEPVWRPGPDVGTFNSPSTPDRLFPETSDSWKGIQPLSTPPPSPPPISEDITATPPATPENPHDALGPQVVTISHPVAAELESWRNKGYVSVPGLRSPEGYPQLVRPDVVGMYTNAATRPVQQPAPVAPPQPPTRTIPGPIGPDQVAGGKFVRIPTKNVNETLIANMKAGGYRLISNEPDGNTIFRLVGNEGGADMITMRLLEGIRNKFRQMTGREPTQQEIDTELSQRGPQAGEQTGRVAQFAPPEQSLTDLIKSYPPEPSDSTVNPRPTDINEARRNADFWKKQWDWALEIDNTFGREFIYNHWKDADDWLTTLETGGLVTQHPPGELSDAVSQRTEPEPLRLFTEAVQGVHEPTPPASGQLDLPLMGGVRQQTRLQDIDQTSQQDPQTIEEWGPVQRSFDFMQRPPQVPPLKKLADFGPDDFNEPSYQRPYEDLTPEVHKRYHVFDENDNLIEKTYDYQEAQRWADENNGYVKDIDREEEPSFAKIEGGGLVAHVNLNRAVQNITRDYTGPLEAVMPREGLQNALDASDKLGSGGVSKIKITKAQGDKPANIEVSDNGSGMDEKTLAEKLMGLFETGKEGESGASGGKGIGSASYIYGGRYFTVETIAVDTIDGKKYRIVASGTPDQFLDQERGSNWEKVKVPAKTPTGTTFKVDLLDEQDVYHAREMLSKIARFTRNRPSTLIHDSYGMEGSPSIHDMGKSSDAYSTRTKFLSSENDKLIGDLEFNDNNVKIQIPPFDETVERSYIDVHYLNNGMYQFSDSPKYIGDSLKGLPESIIVDIHPTMEDIDPRYPFINTRQDVKGDIREFINQYINENIGAPAVSKRKNRTQELYDSMPDVAIGGTRRRPVIYDPGERLTAEETDYLANHPTIVKLVQFYDSLIDSILSSTGRTKWIERLEGVGIVLDPGSHGIHIPNPTTGKSTILINPFLRIEDYSLTPEDAAWKGTITHLHEVAHIGDEKAQVMNPITPEDMLDPRVGKYLTSYIEQINIHGDVGYKHTGHAMDFAHRLGEVYGRFGVDATYKAADAYHTILTRGSESGGYSPEIQELLRLYQESRGRDATTEDLLSRTGVKQANRGRDAAGNIPGSNQTDGDGTTRWGRVKQATGWGQGGTKGGRQDPEEFNFVKEALSVPSAATTMLDASAPGRQGLTQILTPQFWQAAGKMFKGLSPAAFKQMNDDLRDKPLMTPQVNLVTGEVGKSFGEKLGLKIYEPASSNIGPRAENTASRWLESGIGKGPISRAYANTLGVPIRASNRMYLTFLNHLSVNRAEFLMNRARDMSVQALETGKAPMQGMLGGVQLPEFMGGANIGLKQKYSQTEAMDLNPYHNLVLAKEIVDFVNTATGHAPLKTHYLPIKQAELSLEGAAKKLSSVLFSPGLLFSRLRMTNPNTYIMASPYVRKQYMKAALSTAAAWFAFTEMAKMAGGDEVQVSDDITSADFGKVRIGDTRMDPGGGFLQFLVAYGRMIKGGYTSSASGKFHRFGSGYQAQTQEDSMERFLVNKLNPVTKFAYDLGNASEYNPFHVGDRTMQMFVPLVVQDMNELAKENPELLPWMVPISLGMGTQTYGKGESVGKLIPPEDDWLVTGGGFSDFMPEFE